MKTATQTSLSVGGFAGPAQHFALSEPLCGNSHVIVWTQDAFGQQAAEAVIVAARPDGSAITMTRLPGSYVHPDPSVDAALELAGYQVVRE
ncbi:hypothetical protein VMT65_22395 [Nocardia sp. CDC153]|uniref:hypothetical protein n=1 Tax=Nocardia sp. CDC153 TaxID=3112167 RepID=UPI002DB6030A|nr:hypothetical protein [Nocardia sp. CDC153]MEC3955800.1 hypothetical protein [Nocardia sp. CDC153]